MVRLVDELDRETRRFHAEADEELLRLQRPTVSPADYWRFLTRCYGWIAPFERAVLAVPHLDAGIDTARFHKRELLRSDLICFRMKEIEIAALPQYAMPALASIEDALGWAYPVERSTITHANVYRHLAAIMPGDVAFTSSYLKCYLGTSGQPWRAFGTALDRIGESSISSRQRVIDAATAACSAFVDWRRHSLHSVSSLEDSGEQRIA